MSAVTVDLDVENKGYAARMAKVFVGNQDAHYLADFNNLTIEANGKHKPRYLDAQGAPSVADFLKHLQGKRGGNKGLLVIPVTRAGACRFGKIDVDDYGDRVALARDCHKKIKRLGLPLVVEFSKSGGVHLAHYSPITQSAADMRAKLTDWAAALGLTKCEIFPKQDRLAAGDTGNGINLPFFGGDSDSTVNYAVDSEGRRMSVERWLDVIEKMPTNAVHTPGEVDIDGAADYLVRWWVDGQRDLTNLAALGTMGRIGVDEAIADQIVAKAKEIAADPEVRRSAQSVYRALALGDKRIPGFTSLAELMDNSRDNAKEFCRLVGGKPSPQDLEPPIRMVSFTLEDLRAPIREETYLLPGMVPTEAYTLLAGALSSYKSMLLLNMIVWRATGYDLLNFSDDMMRVPKSDETGPCVLASYEDTDWRIFARLQRILLHGEAQIKEVHGSKAAEEFLLRAIQNIQRIPLTGMLGKTLVFRENGYIVPNLAFLDEFRVAVRAFTTGGVMIGLDPLRLALAGSQNDDDGADVAVQILNQLSVINPNSGIAVVSHSNKSDSKDGGTKGDFADAAYGTSGSALYSQHARSNFRVARLKPEEIRQQFDLPESESERQTVAKLKHGRLSHGLESEEFFIHMSGAGMLSSLRPRAKEVSAAQSIGRAFPLIAGAIKRLLAQNLIASQNAIIKDSAFKTHAGSEAKARDLIKLIESQELIKVDGATINRRYSVTQKGEDVLRGIAETR